MSDQEVLQAISQMMDQKLEPISQKFTTLEEKVDALTETHEETRAGVNTLLEWAEDVGTSITFPLPKIAKIAKQSNQ